MNMTKQEALKQAYDTLINRYWGNRLYTLTHWGELLKPNLEKLKQKSGPLHCTNLNLLLKESLLASGLFSQADIKSYWTLLWGFSPHQYLKVKTETGWIAVDIWAKKFGIDFGDHAHGFHLKTK